MLQDFLTRHRGQIIARTRERVTKRRVPRATDQELETGVPLFLEQLRSMLEHKTMGTAAISESATQHATALVRDGFTVSQVVHGYGDVCQIVTGLAIELDEPISTDEFRTLNRCLDEAIAAAVTEFSRLREESIAGAGTERLGHLAHEIRNVLGSAIMSFDMIRGGTVPIAGSTGAILGRSLSRLQSLVDRSLAEVRLESGVKHRERLAVADLLEELAIAATARAKMSGVHFELELCASRPTVLGDRHILGSALDNIVQNAIKFTPRDGRVTMTARIEGEDVIIDVADECGGLAPGDPEGLFEAFEQRDADRSGFGLGLAISRRGVRSMGGDITIRDYPGKGCVFSIRVPVAR